MRWNPYLNAFCAIAYIGCVVLFLRFIESVRHDTPDTIVDGIGFISLFVFSTAVMSFLFFYTPLLLLMENSKREALIFFAKTLATFGVLTIILLVFTSLQ